MNRHGAFWEIVRTYALSTNEWTALTDIYEVVRRRYALGPEDWAPYRPSHSEPRWQRDVRNVLQRRKRKGEITWDGDVNYRLA